MDSESIESQPAGRLGAPLLVALLTLASIATGLLRSFHRDLPHWGWLPTPIGSLLFLLFALLLSWHLLQRRNGLDLHSSSDEAGVSAAQFVPVLAVMVGEKWIDGDLLSRLFDLLDRWTVDSRLGDGLYRGISGLALALAALLLLPIVRPTRRRLLRVLTFARLRRALKLGLLSAVVPVVLIASVAIPTGARLAVASHGAGLAVDVGAQLIRAFAEELYFRGILQISVTGLLLKSGMAASRLTRSLGIVIVSLGFALEHLDPELKLAALLPTLLYVFLISCLLGGLLESSRNLWLVILVHAVLNLWNGGWLPLPFGATRTALLPGSVVGLSFLVAIYVGVTVIHARRQRAPRSVS